MQCAQLPCTVHGHHGPHAPSKPMEDLLCTAAMARIARACHAFGWMDGWSLLQSTSAGNHAMFTCSFSACLDVTLVTLCRALVTRVTAMAARRLLSTCAPIGSPSSQTRVQVAELCINGVFLFGAGGICGLALSHFSNLSERVHVVHELDRSTQAHMGKVEVHLDHLQQRMGKVDERLDQLEQNVSVMRQDMSKLRADVSTLGAKMREDMAFVKEFLVLRQM